MDDDQIIEAKSVEIRRLHAVCKEKQSNIITLSEHIQYILSIIEGDNLITPQYRKQLTDLLNEVI